MTATLEREVDSITVRSNTANMRAVSSFVSNTTSDAWMYTGGNTQTGQIWRSPNTIYVGGQSSPPFAPCQQSPFEGLEALGRVKDFTVPTHNYEPHCDILGNPVGCKHCSYANVHKLDPASHPFTIHEEA